MSKCDLCEYSMIVNDQLTCPFSMCVKPHPRTRENSEAAKE